MNQENFSNSKIIAEYLQANFSSPKTTTVLDICCGVYDKNGTNYDQTGAIYQPVVGDYFVKKGFDVTGIDFRKSTNKQALFPTLQLDILEPNWAEKIKCKFDVVSFLRSWDTPEIALFYQKKYGITNLNEITLLILKDLILEIEKLVENQAIFIFSEPFNNLICEKKEILNLWSKFNQILGQYNFFKRNQVNGLYFYHKIC